MTSPFSNHVDLSKYADFASSTPTTSHRQIIIASNNNHVDGQSPHIHGSSWPSYYTPAIAHPHLGLLRYPLDLHWIPYHPMSGLPNEMASYPAPYSPQHPPVPGSTSGANDGMAPQHLPIAPATYQYDNQALPQPSNLYQSPPSNGQPGGSQHGGQAEDAGGKAQKGSRLNKACDTCSSRKVRCDNEGPPCKPCAALEIPCTYDRPSKRRGPPNKHAEALKKRKVGDGSIDESPTSPDNIAATLASFSSHAVHGAESICPLPVLELLVDDFFTYIYPLTPFPHEPSFRYSFSMREDLRNQGFLALLASMIKTLVTSFPRRPRLHLKQHNFEHLFPTSIAFMERCHKVAVEARGVGFLDKDLIIYDAATSYFLGLAEAYTNTWRQCKLYFGETLTILNVLGAHKSEGTQASNEGTLPQPRSFIEQEISRRIFWVMFVGIRSMQQLGLPISELIMPPPTPKNPYPPLPLEIDDEYISEEQIISPQPGIVSKITGFNLNIAIYKTLTPLTTMELAYGIDEAFDLARQKKIFAECLHSAEQVLKDAPPELLLQPGSQPGEFATSSDSKYPPISNYPPGISNGHNLGQWSQPSREDRRKLQYEIQKANIYASQLSTRSYIIEKYFPLQEAHQLKQNSAASAGQDPTIGSPENIISGLETMGSLGPTSGVDATQAHFASQREEIIKELLRVITSINQVNMEPNGGSFVHKIRQIASPLITATQSRMGPFALKAQEDLNMFLNLLVKLDSHSYRGDESFEAGEDDEQQLRHWADLRQHQMRFAQAGGFLSEL